ncbi:MAG: hypothetical protein QM704_24835 [Anaeromyxobacteraceae bacterium]
MAIQAKRVVGGGLVAGLVICASAALMVPVVGDEMAAAQAARGVPPMGPGAMAFFFVFSLSLGVLVVWLYAALLPRFGPGPRTALLVAMILWFLTSFSSSAANVAYGFMPLGLTVVGMTWGLAELVLAALVGTRLYREA